MQREPEEFSIEILRNRSLSLIGRKLSLILIGGTTLSVSLGITLIFGAWPVLPYAGLEILVLLLGFRWLAWHDGDYERITVHGTELRHELFIRAKLNQRSWNTHWCTLLCRTRGCRVELAVRSHGAEFRVGQMMMDEDRAKLAVALHGLVKVQNSSF
jgi:uncharacterized membrane protein